MIESQSQIPQKTPSSPPILKSSHILSISHVLKLYKKALAELGKEEATIESYLRDARTFLNYINQNKMNYHQVIPDSLVHFQNHLQYNREEKNNSIRRSVIGVRQFYRFLVDSRLLSTSPFEEIPIPFRDESLRQGISEEQFQTLIDTAAKDNYRLKSLRDLALLSLLGLEGVKATELIALCWSDFMMSQQQPHTPDSAERSGTLFIAGAAKREQFKKRSRVITLDPLTVERIADYKAHFFSGKNHQEKANSTPHKIQMFCAFKGRAGALQLPSMTRHGVKFALYELGESAGIKKINSEALRHHAVQHLLGKGKTTEEIMIHLGLKQPGNIAKHYCPIQSKIQSSPQSFPSP